MARQVGEGIQPIGQSKYQMVHLIHCRNCSENGGSRGTVCMLNFRLSILERATLHAVSCHGISSLQMGEVRDRGLRVILYGRAILLFAL